MGNILDQLDLTPLFRSTIGFDRLSHMLESALNSDGDVGGYPPYNILQVSPTSWRIEMAVAGFTQEQLALSFEPGLLSLRADVAETKEPETATYLHRGMARRGFTRRFQLADHVEVREADLVNGVLTVTLELDMPEGLKPRQIDIGSSALVPSDSND